MSDAVLLLVLRIISALLLLSFLVIIVWLSYKDILLATEQNIGTQQFSGNLEIISSDSIVLSPGRRYTLLPVTSIGRSIGNSIVLDDEYASGEHALLSLRGNIWWVEDLGSRNGTLLNDLPVQSPTVISNGDIITIGQTQFKVDV